MEWRAHKYTQRLLKTHYWSSTNQHQTQNCRASKNKNKKEIFLWKLLFLFGCWENLKPGDRATFSGSLEGSERWGLNPRWSASPLSARVPTPFMSTRPPISIQVNQTIEFCSISLSFLHVFFEFLAFFLSFRSLGSSGFLQVCLFPYLSS